MTTGSRERTNGVTMDNPVFLFRFGDRNPISINSITTTFCYPSDDAMRATYGFAACITVGHRRFFCDRVVFEQDPNDPTLLIRGQGFGVKRPHPYHDDVFLPMPDITLEFARHGGREGAGT